MKFVDGTTDLEKDLFYRKFQARLEDKLEIVRGLKRLSLLDNVNEALVRRFEAHPLVEYAEPNYILTTDVTPNDPQFGQLWGLNNTGQTGGTADRDIDAPEAWDVNTGSAAVVIGIIDTGVNYNHEDLAANIWTNPGETPGNGIDDDGNGYVDDVHGINAITNTGNPMDDNGHGSHTAGTIGAQGNNGIGVTGVNWTVKIAACKFLNAAGSGTTADAIECFNYFNNLKTRTTNTVNVRVTNNSWGGGGFSQALKDAMDGPVSMAEILHTAAAGNANNNNDGVPSYPASYDLNHIVAVAATDHNDLYASFSNFGATHVDLAAPGVNILSTYIPGNSYTSLNGTSMATPHVAGAAALVWAQHPSLTAAQVKQRILFSADYIGNLGSNASKPTLTNARLNVSRAVENDTAPPAVVTNLGLSGTLTTQTLTWTAVGDDGLVGTASSYDVRYSTSTITTDANWAAATQAVGEPTPKLSGLAESFTVTGLEPSTTYYFALRVIDNVGNESPLSNVAVGTTSAGTTVFADSMENGPGGWTSTGLWHQSTCRSNSPTSARYYGQEPTAGNCTDYNTGAANSGTLTSPAISLAGATEATLRFFEWSQVESIMSYDRTRVQISTNGTTWTTVFESHGTNNAWANRSVNLTPYVGGNVQVRFWFDTVDGVLNNYAGWFVDDVQVVVATASAPPDTTEPTVTINQTATQADPTNASPINFTVAFSEAVTGFATGDVTLGGSAGATTAVVTGGPATYNVAVSGMTSVGTVIATVGAGVATDSSGNPNLASTSSDNTVTYDNAVPTVTINQAATQADPTNASPINFTVAFSEAVTGFVTGDVTLGGSAGATTAVVTGGPQTYNVAVSGMTSAGTVIATVGAGVATDAAGNTNVASSSSDNTVTYDNIVPTVTINQAATQADPTNASPIDFTVTFSEAVTGFASGDVTLGGTTGATTAVVTGGPTTYNVAVSGMSSGGMVTATVGAGVATDAAGNTNAASSSSDNTVTYDNTVPTVTLYFSLGSSATLNGVSVANEDIVAFNGTNFSQYFDGSDVGIGSFTLDAFSIINATEILMSFTNSGSIPGISGTVDDSDIVKFTATTLGTSTAGTFALYFDGSDVGLSSDSEDVDAVEVLDNGNLLISTTGSVSVTGVSSGADEDILQFTPTSLGSNTTGTWTLYFDGSDVGLADSGDEDVDAVALDASGKIYLSTTGNFSVTGSSGADEDVFVFNPSTLGSSTSGTYGPGLFFDGSVYGLSGNDIFAIDIPTASMLSSNLVDQAVADLHIVPADDELLTDLAVGLAS